MTKSGVEVRLLRRTVFLFALIGFILLTLIKTQRDLAQQRAESERVAARDEASGRSRGQVAMQEPPSNEEETARKAAKAVAEYTVPDRGDYQELFSTKTRDRRYIQLFMSGEDAYNPTIIPHPTRHDMWILVAHQERREGRVSVSQQCTCEAGFLDDVLVCESPPAVLPLEPSIYGSCPGELEEHNYHSGPRETRMFYSRDVPYLLYGSQSKYTCIGAYLEDARPLLTPFFVEQTTRSPFFKGATEIHRPNSFNGIEGKSFLFWDSEGAMYAHYDLFPKRAFAQVNFDGAVTDNQAGKTEYHDQVCMAQYMPPVGRNESIQQATNALHITLCERNDPGCVPNDSNTFIMHMFHRKSNYDGHAEYEPFVVLFQQSAPFAIHSISQRPFWIHGRGALTKGTGAKRYLGKEEEIPEGHSEAFYLTSMSWKTHGQTYHGYINDDLFLGFGIEETKGGVIDIKAKDLLQDLGFCDMRDLK